MKNKSFIWQTIYPYTIVHSCVFIIFIMGGIVSFYYNSDKKPVLFKYCFNVVLCNTKIIYIKQICLVSAATATM